MLNGTMDPELMRIAQEQMSRIPPEDLARIQQQMLANPELLRLATESMNYMTPEDMRRAAEQLKYTRSEDMVEVSEKIAKTTPEEFASMKARADAQISYELNAAKMLKKQGNELHSHGQYHDAAKKYLLAKNNIKGIPSSMSATLQLQCSLNLMSCYLKTKQFDDCIKEGSEVLASDSNNVKAFYRRGQAHKELGNLEAAVSDLNKARELSPDDETIANVLRDAEEELMKNGRSKNQTRGLVIEEVTEEESQSGHSDSHRSSPVPYSVTTPVEAGECSQDLAQSNPDAALDKSMLENFRDDPETMRLFQNYVSNADPGTLESSGLRGISPDMLKTTKDMISKMKPSELQKMIKVASSLNGKGPDRSMSGSKFPEMSPEMIKMASDTISKMSPQEFQEMLKVASKVNTNGSPFQMATAGGGAQRSESVLQSSVASGSSPMEHSSSGEISSNDSFISSRMSQSSPGIPTKTADFQENMHNSMRDPAMKQMLTSMMKNVSPEMLANMSEQFGMKLSKEDAAKAQQAMSQLSPEDLDRMMRWAERAQRVVEAAKKTKNWLLGRPGLILAIVMLILAFILHHLGFIGQ